MNVHLSDLVTCFLPCCCIPTVYYVSPGDGKCVVCDSYVRPATLVRVCEECNYGSLAGRCVICGGVGVSDAFYCKECTVQEKDVSFRILVILHVDDPFFLSACLYALDASIFKEFHGPVEHMCACNQYATWCVAERWLSKDYQPGICQNRSVL